MKSISHMTHASFLSVLAVLCASALPAHAGEVSLSFLTWEFYQGGFVQKDPRNFQVFQDHYRDNPEENIVSATLGGASFQSKGFMEDTLVETGDSLSLHALNTFIVSASVDRDTQEGLAHAFAGLSQFIAGFTIDSGLWEYTGTQPLEDQDGKVHESGSILNVGKYSYVEIDPFPPLTQTEIIGSGESETVMSEREIIFNFEFIPGPGGFAVVVGAMFISRRRRRS